MTTYDDLINALLAYGATDATKNASQQHRRAVQLAYQSLVTLHPWNYYWTLGRITTSAPYSTGTVAVTAATRTVTLTDGTWPTWAASGYIRINDTSYTVATRVSSTVLTLAADTSPADDVAAGTAYQLIRDRYPLPTDFVASDEPAIGLNGEPIEYTHARTWATVGRWQGVGRPTCFAYTGSPTAMGQLQIVLGPAPDAAYPIDFVYRRKPRAMIFDGAAVGTVSVAANGVAVTGSGTAFKAAMVGSVLRLGSNSKTPPTGLGGLAPRAHEATITAVASETSLTIDSGPADAADRVAFTVSDPADVDEVAMTELLYRECERHWRTVSRSAGGPLSTLKAEETEYRLALQRAMEADNRYRGRRASLRARRGYDSPHITYPSGVAGED